MDIRQRKGAGPLIAGFAAIGVVVAHFASFSLVAPDPHDRAALLAQTGHGNWVFVIALAIGAVAAGMLRFATAAPTSESPSPSLRGTIVRRIWLLLAALQIVGFVVVESIERLGAELAPWHLFSEPVVWLGFALQILVAALGAAALLLFVAFVRRVHARTQVVHEHVAAIHPPQLRSHAIRSFIATGPRTLRGPPPQSL